MPSLCSVMTSSASTSAISSAVTITGPKLKNVSILLARVKYRSVAEDDAAHVLGGHKPAGLADDHAQLALGIHVVGDVFRRQHDISTGFEHAGGRLHEAARLLGLHGVDVLRVREIVESDAPDLGR